MPLAIRQAIGASCIRPLAGCAGAVCGLTDGGDWGMTEGVGGGGGEGAKGGQPQFHPGDSGKCCSRVTIASNASMFRGAISRRAVTFRAVAVGRCRGVSRPSSVHLTR